LEEETISEILVADMASESGVKASNVRRLFLGRRGTTAVASLSRISHNKQWPARSTHCSAICVLAVKERCDVVLSLVPCFVEYPTKVNL